ncbi:response regulator [Phenylobacterium sp. 20VBR1]|uniref:Sensory/regulatory protein RpfC n=1 Tax=Phenylobacterium glaciei TaxID=2803784 RepID=A0A941CY75_9CAUL|nr:response regulator [Phenylobacterium glaciei]
MAGGVSLLAYTSISVDRVQVAEERELVAQGIDRTLMRLVSGITTVSVRDEAYARLGPNLDARWADRNLGGFYADHMGHDLTLVFNAKDQPVYAWRKDRRLPADEAGVLAPAVAPLLARLRSEEQIGPDRRGKTYGLDAELTTSGIVVAGGQYFMVGAATVTPETPAARLRPGRAAVVVSARRLDGGFLHEVDDNLHVTQSRISPPGVLRIPSRVPVVDVNGFVVGDLAWSPKRPGVTVLKSAAPVFLLAFLVLMGAALAMALRIKTIFRDLTLGEDALERTMGQLVRARDQADTANVAKSQFLANMSHEIRTPLNGVLGMAQVMARDELSPIQSGRLSVIRASGQTLLSVLNDVLDISKIEAGRLEVDNHEFDVAEAVSEACATFTNLAAQKDVTLDLYIAAEANGIWWGDGARLRQVISNLVSNAVKFTADGVVSVTVTPSAEGLTFAVRDSGIGIPPSRLGDLFQKFSQVDASTNRRFGGTGLGLAICRELVELMGGRIGVTSIVGEGSTFSFTLPMEKRAEARARRTVEIDTPNTEGFTAKILAAEDNPTNQLILKSLLEPFGIDLTVVANGLEAVEAVKTQAFDLVLMDIQMPEMSGVEATQAIRAFEAQTGRPALPILALSANVMRHQINEYLDAGMSGFVPKPIEAVKLFAAIDEALAPADEEIEAETVAA